MPHTNYVSAIAFDPAGKVVAAGDYSGQVRFWDTATGREVGRPCPQGEIVMSLAYSPDGKMLAAGLANDHSGKAGVRLWDTMTRHSLSELLPSTDPVTRVEYRPDGRALLAGSNRGFSIRLWDVIRQEPLGAPIVDEVADEFAADGRAFLTLGKDGAINLRDAATGAILASLLSTSSRADLCGVSRRWRSGRRGFRGRHGPALRPGDFAAGRSSAVHETRRS